MTSRQVKGLALVVGLASWVGLGYVVLTQYPTMLTRILLFPLLFLAIASVAVPGLSWLRLRLGQEQEAGVLLREAAWAGLFVSLLAALQLARMLDGIVVLVMVAIFVLLELFLLQRPERMRRLWIERTARRRGVDRSVSKTTGTAKRSSSNRDRSRTNSTKSNGTTARRSTGAKSRTR